MNVVGTQRKKSINGGCNNIDMNSRNKGKEGERQLAKKLQEYGFATRRGQQYCGIQGNADVVGLDGIHIECKRCEQVRDEVFLQQAERDAKEGEIPVFMYRRNPEEWKVTLRLEDFMTIYKSFLQNRTKSEKE